MLSRMANFDDADPLRLEAAVDFEFIPPGRPLPRAADLIVLFGSKSTLAELRFLRQQGWDHDIIAHARSGGRVLGLCGGYQMLGRSIVDASGTDGSTGIAEGLGLLDVVTHMQTEKTVRQLTGVCATSGLPIRGYEIHVGITHGEDCLRPVLRSGGIAEGARSPDGLVEGSYVHGLFADDRFRRHFLARLKKANSVDSLLDYSACIDNALDELADGLEKALDIERLFASARAPGWSPDPAQQLSLARQLQRA
jgi:adenosylcobyric acid synthase